jgi:hypothetical protein
LHEHHPQTHDRSFLALYLIRRDLRWCQVAFMSTTAEYDVARHYSSRGKLGVIFVMETGMVDRGASLKDFSQYPHENEVLLPPLTGAAWRA